VPRTLVRGFLLDGRSVKSLELKATFLQGDSTGKVKK